MDSWTVEQVEAHLIGGTRQTKTETEVFPEMEIEITSVENISNMCRVCLSTTNLVNIFEEQLAAQLIECTALPVYKDDNLPSLICATCRENVVKFHAFKSLCLNSYVFLRHSVHKICETNKPESVAINEIETEDNLENYIGKNIKPELVTVENFEVDDLESSNELFNLINPLDYQESEINSIDCKMKESLICNYCKETFTTKDQLEEHILNHQNKIEPMDRQSQPISDIVDLSPSNLIKSRNFKCIMCKLTFLTKRRYTTHNRNVHNDTSINCVVCEETLRNSEEYNEHMALHHQIINKKRVIVSIPDDQIEVCEILPSNQGNMKLLIRGHLMLRNKILDTNGARCNWGCRKQNCKGRAITINVNGEHHLKQFIEHNHPPNSVEIATSKIKTAIKMYAMQTDYAPDKIIQINMATLPEEFKSGMPSVHALRRTIQRVRSKLKRETNRITNTMVTL